MKALLPPILASVLLMTVACAGGRTPPPPLEPTSPPASVPAPRREGLPVGFGDRMVSAKALSTFDERARGFMGRDLVDDGEALIFVYRTADERRFWMKGCLVAIDILYLADDGVVQEMATLPPPAPGVAEDDLPRFVSTRPTRLVLEVRAGLSAEAGVVPGTKIVLPADVERLIAEAPPQ